MVISLSSVSIAVYECLLLDIFIFVIFFKMYKTVFTQIYKYKYFFFADVLFYFYTLWRCRFVGVRARSIYTTHSKIIYIFQNSFDLNEMRITLTV